MGMNKTEPEELLVVPKQFNDVAYFKVTTQRSNLVAEYPLVSGNNSMFFVLFEQDLFFHRGKLESF